MHSDSEIIPLVDDLAALWTDSVLEILRVAGIRNITVAMELETWRMLKKVLRGELRWQRSFRFTTLVSLSTLREQALRKAALLVMHKLEPGQISYEFEKQVRRLAGDQKATPQQRRLYARLITQPSVPAAFKSPSRTDFVPHLRAIPAGN